MCSRPSSETSARPDTSHRFPPPSPVALIFEQQSGDRPSSFARSQGEAKQVTPSFDQKQVAREVFSLSSLLPHLPQTIKRLEQLIESYEGEMKHGTREIDAIQEDIRRTKSEILTLRRKHLNFFYYF
jgi:peptidoglycan hydrolase CwlO-like protein